MFRCVTSFTLPAAKGDRLLRLGWCEQAQAGRCGKDQAVQDMQRMQVCVPFER